MGFSGFYWVLLDFSEFSWVSMGFTEFYRVFLALNRNNMSSLYPSAVIGNCFSFCSVCLFSSFLFPFLYKRTRC